MRAVRHAEHSWRVDITFFTLRYFPYLPLLPPARKWKNNLKVLIIRHEIWWQEVVCMYNVALKKVMYIVLCNWCKMYHSSFLRTDRFCLRRHVTCAVDKVPPNKLRYIGRKPVWDEIRIVFHRNWESLGKWNRVFIMSHIKAMWGREGDESSS